MGLLEDIIGGMLGPQAGGRAAPGGQGGGMSPIVMALLAFLAQRAMSGSRGAPGGGGGGLGDILGDILGGGQPGGRPAQIPGGGGLGDILGDILGGGRPGGAGQPAPAPSGRRARVPQDQDEGSGSGGGLGDILGEILGGGSSSGGAPAGRRGGSGLDELSDIVDRFDKSGQGAAAQSWVGRGANQAIAPDQMSAVLDDDTINQLTAATGIDRDELLAGLAQALPSVVDQLTPDGRLPTPQEWQGRF